MRLTRAIHSERQAQKAIQLKSKLVMILMCEKLWWVNSTVHTHPVVKLYGTLDDLSPVDELGGTFRRTSARQRGSTGAKKWGYAAVFIAHEYYY